MSQYLHEATAHHVESCHRGSDLTPQQCIARILLQINQINSLSNPDSIYNRKKFVKENSCTQDTDCLSLILGKSVEQQLLLTEQQQLIER